ncbi:MAG TPA: thiamine pyrophosphate-dependent enzyme [Acetobacteraceae bacterium]|nr:thiamine pyrophosphate-dependent enzyme [Acetobacteraceae bacterium]
MPTMFGKTALLELLKQEGVRVMFGNPGTTELPLMDALAVEQDIRYVLALQEAPAMAMADGFALASGGLAVVNLHVAPGLGNALGMLYDAQKAGSPVLVTAGQHEQTFNLTEPLLWADLPRIAQPFVKWSYEVRRLEDLPRAVHRAAKTALAPPTGPVFLSLPGDVLTASADIELGAPTRIAARIRGDAEALASAAALIARSEHPVIIAGDAVAQSGGLAELVALAEAVGAPVYDEGMASRTMFPSTHPLYRGNFARLPATIRGILQDHDLLISAGGDLFTLSLPGAVEAMPDFMKIVHLDNDPWEIGKNYPADVAILGDPKATLPELLRGIESAMTPEARARAEARRAEAAAEGERGLARLREEAARVTGRTPIHPLALMEAVAALLPDNAVVVDETVSSGAGLRRFLRSTDPQSFFGLRGGGIGWGLPAAIGIKLALPHRPVVALIGDGSAMYTIQGLWTAAHERLAGLVFVIINNSSYRILKQRVNAMQQFAAQTGRFVGMELEDPAVDYVSIAKGMGLMAQHATGLDEARGMLTDALRADGPVLVDVKVDRAFKLV